MRAGKRILTAFVIFAAVGTVVLQIVLSRHLTGIIRSRFIPLAEAQLGTGVDLDRFAVSLLGAVVTADGFRIHNPEGAADVVSMGHGRLNLGVLPLLTGKVRVSDLEARDVVISLSADQDIRFGRVEKVPDADKPATAETNETAEPVHVRIDALDLETRFVYMTSSNEAAPERIELQLHVTGQDLANYDLGTRGRFFVNGHLASDPSQCQVNLRCDVAAIRAGAIPDFDLGGSIEKIDQRLVEAFVHESGIEGDSISVGFHLVCRDGLFVKGSELRFQVSNARLSEKKAKKLHVSLPPDFSLTVPIKGSIDDPEMDLTTALLQGVISGFSSSSKTSSKGSSDGLGKAIRQFSDALKKNP
jgi:hypothetical protein